MLSRTVEPGVGRQHPLAVCTASHVHKHNTNQRGTLFAPAQRGHRNTGICSPLQNSQAGKMLQQLGHICPLWFLAASNLSISASILSKAEQAHQIVSIASSPLSQSTASLLQAELTGTTGLVVIFSHPRWQRCQPSQLSQPAQLKQRNIRLSTAQFHLETGGLSLVSGLHPVQDVCTSNTSSACFQVQRRCGVWELTSKGRSVALVHGQVAQDVAGTAGVSKCPPSIWLRR